MASSPTMRSCPSFKFAARFIVSRHTFGAINGSKPSITRTRQRAAKKSMVVERAVRGFHRARFKKSYFAFAPFFKNLKKSALGSSTITSLLFLNVALYASRLR